MRRIAETGGQANVIIEPSGEENIGDVPTERTVARLNDLKGLLGVKVSPRVNAREDKYIFAGDS